MGVHILKNPVHLKNCNCLKLHIKDIPYFKHSKHIGFITLGLIFQAKWHKNHIKNSKNSIQCEPITDLVLTSNFHWFVIQKLQVTAVYKPTQYLSISQGLSSQFLWALAQF